MAKQNKSSDWRVGRGEGELVLELWQRRAGGGLILKVLRHLSDASSMGDGSTGSLIWEAQWMGGWEARRTQSVSDPSHLQQYGHCYGTDSV